MNDYFNQRILDKNEASAYNASMNADSLRTPGPIYISLSGKKQVGKDTAAEMMVKMLETAGHKVKVTAFAEQLKKIAIDVLGLPHDLVYGSNEDKETETHVLWDTFPNAIRLKYSNELCEFFGGDLPRHGAMTIREVLQVMGTDIFREMFESDVWANSPFRRDWSDCDVVLITDCRFPNEKKITEERSGTVIRVERDTGLQDNHRSETALDGVEFEYFYENRGSLDDLRNFMQGILAKLELL